MENSRRIPTVIALLILLIGLGGGIFLAESTLRFFSPSDQETRPQDIQLTNRTASMATISWLTTKNSVGYIEYGLVNGPMKAIGVDDRTRKHGRTIYSTTHHITLNHLVPEQKYQFVIRSEGKRYDDRSKPYIFTTLPRQNLAQINPVYGTVTLPDANPAGGTIVYLTLEDAEPLSALVKPSGHWLIPLNIAHSREDKLPFTTIEGKKIELIIRKSPTEVAQAIADTRTINPLQTIVIGKTYDFRVQTTAQQPVAPDILGASLSETTDYITVDIIQPEHEQALTSNRPLIRGKGIPGKSVSITLESIPQSATVSVDKRGNWSWTPLQKLSPGTHTVTIQTYDQTGKLVNITRKFTVLPSGSRVLGEATPSATQTPSPTTTLTPSPSPTVSATIQPTLTPTLTPTPTLSPTPTTVFEIPTPTATEAGGIQAGYFTPTLLLLSGGSIILLLGMLPLLRRT